MFRILRCRGAARCSRGWRSRGDERVADLGCGTGRLTRELAARLPHGEVVALDASRQMLEQAVAHLADVSPPVKFVEARLPDIPLAGWADVVFSTATFHWVRDHPALFSNIRTALKPGGLLHAQCGGGPNLAQARAPAEDVMRLPAFARWFAGFEGAWEFADDRVTAGAARGRGFHRHRDVSRSRADRFRRRGGLSRLCDDRRVPTASGAIARGAAPGVSRRGRRASPPAAAGLHTGLLAIEYRGGRRKARDA